MVRSIGAFLNVCFLLRRSEHSTETLSDVEAALEVFHETRQIFISTGVRTTISLPRQHALVHYPLLIREFGAPNGLCSSITESKHITAVKKPWRRSSRNQALGQILVTNQRLDKLGAARVDFQSKGMLLGTCLGDAMLDADEELTEEMWQMAADLVDDEAEGGPVADQQEDASIRMAQTQGEHCRVTLKYRFLPIICQSAVANLRHM